MKILWIDNDVMPIQQAIDFLKDEKHDVDYVDSIKDAITYYKKNQYELVLIDVMMKDKKNLLQNTKDGLETGISLARELMDINPNPKIVGCSITNNERIKKWFSEYCSGFINKSMLDNSRGFIRKLLSINTGENQFRSFIVHGHDEQLLGELKSFLQNRLKFPAPIILREQPSSGKTIIEKFEEYADDVDIAFILMSPDDLVSNEKGIEIRRSRQNVIFEMGFFFGKFKRKSGKVILIYKGELEIPSDISGIVYLHTESGIEMISEQLRIELEGIV